MKEYVEQLIGQMRMVRAKALRAQKQEPVASLDMVMEWEEDYLSGSKKKLSDILGIARMYLPPPEKLEKEEIYALAVEMEALWKVFHFYPDFPEGLPAALRYRSMRKYWDKEVITMQTGEYHIEFCSYDEKKCPFPGYCRVCEEIKKDMDLLGEDWD